jgi:hypothetical protein
LFLTPGLESRVACAAFEKVNIGSLEMAQALLQGDTRNVSQELIFFFPLCEHRAGRPVRWPFAGLLILSPARHQGVIECPAHTAKERGKRTLLARGGVKPQSVINLHKTLVRSEAICSDEHLKEKTFTLDPGLKDGVSSLPDEEDLLNIARRNCLEPILQGSN